MNLEGWDGNDRNAQYIIYHCVGMISTIVYHSAVEQALNPHTPLSCGFPNSVISGAKLTSTS